MTNNVHQGHRERLKHRFLQEGGDAFTDHQLLELLLFYCIPRKDTNETAHKMIDEFGSLSQLFDAKSADIINRCHVSESAAAFLTLLPAVAKRYIANRYGRERPMLNDPATAGEFVLSLFTDQVSESFYVVCLNARRILLHAVKVGTGTIDEAPVYPREIAAAALRLNACRVILAHNHPGGTNNPSAADIEATKAIISALDLLNIEVVDHIIAAGDKYFSFAAYGLLDMAY